MNTFPISSKTGEESCKSRACRTIYRFPYCGRDDGSKAKFQAMTNFLLDNLSYSYSIGINKNLSETNTMTKLALLLLLSELPMTVADKGSVY